MWLGWWDIVVGVVGLVVGRLGLGWWLSRVVEGFVVVVR